MKINPTAGLQPVSIASFKLIHPTIQPRFSSLRSPSEKQVRTLDEMVAARIATASPLDQIFLSTRTPALTREIRAQQLVLSAEKEFVKGNPNPDDLNLLAKLESKYLLAIAIYKTLPLPPRNEIINGQPTGMYIYHAEAIDKLAVIKDRQVSNARSLEEKRLAAEQLKDILEINLKISPLVYRPESWVSRIRKDLMQAYGALGMEKERAAIAEQVRADDIRQLAEQAHWALGISEDQASQALRQLAEGQEKSDSGN